jgi:hypothetical protein
MKHFLGDLGVDDTRGGLYSPLSLPLPSFLFQTASFVACFAVFLPSDVEMFVASCGRREMHAPRSGVDERPHTERRDLKEGGKSRKEWR